MSLFLLSESNQKQLSEKVSDTIMKHSNGMIYCTHIEELVFFYLQEEFEDTKEVMKICKSKDRQHNGQMEMDKGTNNNQQKHYTEN